MTSSGPTRPLFNEASPKLALRQAWPSDFGRIHGWLGNPEVQRWWGNGASAEAEIRLAFASEASLCRLIQLNGMAIGYAQAVEFGLTGAPIPHPIGPGTWDCDLFIGSQPHRGLGLGQSALDLLVGEVFSTTLAIACAIMVPVRHERAVRAYERVGFRWVSIAEDQIHGASWVMIRDREPT